MHFETDRLLIRNLAIYDLNVFYNYRSDHEIVKYQSFNMLNKQEASDFIIKNQNRKFGTPNEWTAFAIADKNTDLLLGDFGVFIFDDPRVASFVITLSKIGQGQGYALEAAVGILNRTFKKFNIHRVIETIREDNVDTIQLAEGLGFRQEGHFIQSYYENGQWYNEYQYAMLQDEWIRMHP